MVASEQDWQAHLEEIQDCWVHMGEGALAFIGGPGIFLGLLLPDSRLVQVFLYEYAPGCVRLTAGHWSGRSSVPLLDHKDLLGLGEVTMARSEVPEWLLWLRGAAHGWRQKVHDGYLWTEAGEAALNKARPGRKKRPLPLVSGAPPSLDGRLPALVPRLQLVPKPPPSTQERR